METFVNRDIGIKYVLEKYCYRCFVITHDDVIKWKHFSRVLLALNERKSPVIGGFPWRRPVMRSFDVLYDLRLNKRMSKHSIHRWFDETYFSEMSIHFETGLLPATCLPSCPLTWCPSLVVTNSSQIKIPALRKAVAVRWRYDDALWWHGIRLKHKKHHITYGILWGQSIGDRWIHVTKGQQCGKCSHAMAPSCICSLSPDFIHQHGLRAWWHHQMEAFSELWPFNRGTTRHRWIPLTKTNDAERCWSAWTNGWANNLDASDLRRHHTHYHVTMMDWRKIHRNQTR